MDNSTPVKPKRSFGAKVKRFFGCLFILVLVGTIVGLSIALFIQNRKLSDINNEFTQATANLNRDNENNQITIEDLQTSFKDLNKQVDDLNKENKDLKSKLDVGGFAKISGRILPFAVSADSTLGQNQMVCAENVANSAVQYCMTVSGIKPTYTLVVPEGKYYVTARLMSADNKSIVSTHKAGYTEYVKCIKESSVEKCNKTELSPKMVVVDVLVGGETGGEIKNVEPIDWTIIQ